MSQDSTSAGDVMTTSFVTVDPDATVTEAATRMHREDVAALLVPTTEVGLVTSADVIRTLAVGGDPDETPVSAAMTDGVETVPPEIRLSEAAAMMETLDVSHLPVVDDDVVGMLSADDITAQLS